MSEKKLEHQYSNVSKSRYYLTTIIVDSNINPTNNINANECMNVCYSFKQK